MSDSDLLKSGDPAHGWKGKIGRTLSQSKPWWRPPVRPPQGAPNVLVILLDDLGFAECGCYGAEIATPNIDRLAAGGLRFNNYTTVPMCAPARAALLTGKNPHSVGVGWLTHHSPGYPGYQAGEISLDAPTIAELLREQGYSTYAVGKWHNTADYNLSAAADRSSWPLQRGFDRFYGFLGAATNYFSPGQMAEGNELLSKDAYPQGFYTTDDFANKVMEWIKAHRSVCPDKPFFLHWALNAPHTPHQAKPEDIAKYKGRYDAGWDQIRRERFARQKELGVVGPDWELPMHASGTRSWEDVPESDRQLMSAYMEIYAGLIDNIDQNIGRVLTTLEELGVLDNTLILLTSDNGATSIGGEDGAAYYAEKRVLNNEPRELLDHLLNEGKMGTIESEPAYPKGWANAGNTPFRFFKRTPMNGGIRVPFIVHWPSKVKDRGAVRQEWVHVTDFVPTLVDILGMEYPKQINGYRTRQMDGVSFLPLLLDGTAKTHRTSQYYELEGNRGYVSGRWKIVSLQPPGAKIDLDNWMLFDREKDPTEIHDLAKEKPDLLKELVEKFDADAFANYAYPIDNRTLLKALSHDPHRIEAVNRPYTYYQGGESVPALRISPLIADRDYELTCAFEYSPGMEGVLFAVGDRARGFCAFIMAGELVIHFTNGFMLRRELRLTVTPGPQFLRFSHKAEGGMRGKATIILDNPQQEKPVHGELNMSPVILKLTGEGLEVGLDRLRKVSAEYEGRGTFAYPGRIDWLKIEPGPQAPGSIVNIAEELAQKDW